MKKIRNYFRNSTTRLYKNPTVNRLLLKTFQSFLLGTQKYPVTLVFFRRYGWYYTNLAQFLRQLGDSVSAYDTLLKGLSYHADNHLFHFRISQILRENYQLEESHQYLVSAERLKPGMNTLLKLFFESDHRMFDHGSQTMSMVLDLPLKMIRQQINMIDRTSVHYPEHKDRLNAIRNSIREEMANTAYETSKDISKAVSAAIGQRQISLALRLLKANTVTLDTTIGQRLDRILSYFGNHLDMLDTAWENEISDDTHYYNKGHRISSSEIEPGSLKVVELFLPPAIFDYPPREKQTHETIRETFLNIVEILCNRSDILLVPRMQLNWRECFPKTNGAHILSYHTSAEFNRRHLHVQESPFSGKCSFDYSGFAGFSHIAENHDEITKFVKSADSAVLDANQAEIYGKYVTNNISKYKQPEDSEPIKGPYVFVALQVVTDVVAKLAWMPGVELLETVASYYRGSGMQVVVKRHPFCRSMDVQKCIERLEAAGDAVRTSNSIHEILRNAKRVFTVNSGVGLEALMHGKCVIVSGACDYSYAAHIVKTPAELHRLLADDPRPDERRIKELLYFYIQRYSIASNDKERLKKRISDWLDC